MEPHVFKYSRSTTLPIDWGVVIISLIIALGCWIISGGEVVAGVTVMLVGCGFFGLLYINAKFTTSTLRVDDECITAKAFGRDWKSIKWRDIKIVRSWKQGNIFLRNQMEVFSICTAERDRLYLQHDGPIIFTDSIVDIQSLLEVLRAKSQCHGFPINSSNA